MLNCIGMGTRPWSEIRAKMSPEARARVDAWVQETLKTLPLWLQHDFVNDGETDGTDPAPQRDIRTPEDH
jgi:hypothetical protein